MKFSQQRIHHNDKYSIAFLTNDVDSFNSFVVEDPPRAVKIPGKTGIPSGTIYKLGIRKEDTPLTIKHRAAYNKPGDEWFKYHIEVLGVPGFSNIYVHSGLDADWTEGCVTPGYAFDLSKPKAQQSLSMEATRDFYKIVYPLLEAGQTVLLEVLPEKGCRRN